MNQKAEEFDRRTYSFIKSISRRLLGEDMVLVLVYLELREEEKKRKEKSERNKRIETKLSYPQKRFIHGSSDSMGIYCNVKRVKILPQDIKKHQNGQQQKKGIFEEINRNLEVFL